MKILSCLSALCFAPVVAVVGVWFICQRLLGVMVLLFVAWLTHSIFGLAADVLLVVTVMVGWSVLFSKTSDVNHAIERTSDDQQQIKSCKQSSVLSATKDFPKAVVMDFSAYNRRTKR